MQSDSVFLKTGRLLASAQSDKESSGWPLGCGAQLTLRGDFNLPGPDQTREVEKGEVSGLRNVMLQLTAREHFDLPGQSHPPPPEQQQASHPASTFLPLLSSAKGYRLDQGASVPPPDVRILLIARRGFYLEGEGSTAPDIHAQGVNYFMVLGVAKLITGARLPCHNRAARRASHLRGLARLLRELESLSLARASRKGTVPLSREELQNSRSDCNLG